MYGYTPPTVLAIDPDLLVSPAGFQAVAAGVAAELRRRATWVVVKAADDVVLADDPGFAAEALLRAPAELPGDVDDAAAETLRRHLEDVGVTLEIHPVPTGPTPHSPRSAIVAGTWRDAAAIARMAGAGEVKGWTMEPSWVPDEVDGVAFTAERPDAAMARA